MRVVHIAESAGTAEAAHALLPYRDARDKGPFDVIPAAAFWLTRLPGRSGLDLTRFGGLLVTVLSGAIDVTPADRAAITLYPGDVLCSDVQVPSALRTSWSGDAWLMLVSTPGWAPEHGERAVVRGPEPRRGRPLMTWIYDDDGMSRTEPFQWPYDLAPVPDLASWPRSLGAFVTRRDYGPDGFVPGPWHNGPRRQLAITLNGRAENESGDGTVTRPVPGDLAFIDDSTGRGHMTRGLGDRWMLFVTVAHGFLSLPREK